MRREGVRREGVRREENGVENKDRYRLATS